MLSGEILNGSALSVAILPPPSYLEFYQAMAAIVTLANQQINEDDESFLGKVFFLLSKTDLWFVCFLVDLFF